MKVNQAKKLKELGKENIRLKKIVADLSLSFAESIEAWSKGYRIVLFRRLWCSTKLKFSRE